MIEVRRIEAPTPIIVTRLTDIEDVSSISQEILSSFSKIDAAIDGDSKVYVINVVHGLPINGSMFLEGLSVTRERCPGSPHDKRIMTNIVVGASFWRTLADIASKGLFGGLNVKFFGSEKEAIEWIKNQEKL